VSPALRGKTWHYPFRRPPLEGGQEFALGARSGDRQQADSAGFSDCSRFASTLVLRPPGWRRSSGIPVGLRSPRRRPGTRLVSQPRGRCHFLTVRRTHGAASAMDRGCPLNALAKSRSVSLPPGKPPSLWAVEPGPIRRADHCSSLRVAGKKRRASSILPIRQTTGKMPGLSRSVIFRPAFGKLGAHFPGDEPAAEGRAVYCDNDRAFFNPTPSAQRRLGPAHLIAAPVGRRGCARVTRCFYGSLNMHLHVTPGTPRVHNRGRFRGEPGVTDAGSGRLARPISPGATFHGCFPVRLRRRSWSGACRATCRFVG